MPGLVAFNRRWGIGSDDLVFPIIIENCFRFAWLIAISVVFHVNKDAFDCSSGHLLRIYFIGVITILVTSSVMNIIIIHTSMKGTITNVKPRRGIPIMLYFKLGLLVPETVWVVLGTYWAFGKSYECDPAVVWTVKGAVLFAWVAGFFMLVGILLVFDPVGTQKQKNRIARRMTHGSEMRLSDSVDTASKVWEMRCRLLCCCVAFKQDNRDAFTDVSKLVADFFQDVDLVPTDIAAGLILIQHQQMCRGRELMSVRVEGTAGQSQPDGPRPAISVMSSANCPVPESWMTVKMMSHFMRYALGSYGWPFYLYTNLLTGLCKLATKCNPTSSHIKMPRFLRSFMNRFQKKSYSPLHTGNPNIYKHGRWYEVLDDDEDDTRLQSFQCCACMRSSENVSFDNACECHTAAIKKVTGISDQDLVYVSFHNKFKEIPFYVAVDREHKSVVISIRGTLSLEDALVDLSAEGMPIDIEGVENAYVHGAMLDCANYIKDRLDTLQLLTKAFDLLPGCSRLVIVGHSLGAGVAAILSILLKPRHGDLICFAYSPPGGLMSPSVSAHVQSYVCSVVVGKDLVPRLGLPTMNDLKTKIMQALDECKLPKHRILAKGCLRIACGCFTSAEGDAETAGREEPLLDSGSGARYSINAAEDAAPQHRKKLKQALREAVIQSSTETEWLMTPPGQILHIEEAEEGGLCGGTPDYCASWVAPDSFNEILISPSMVLDHFPDVVQDALQQLHDRTYVPQAQPARPSDATA
ncbi:diacylglycerol lipase-beta-like isoform X2 [Haliotis rufescens]|uniref:diacylglycerol lipase-beta-like isoform X1 n=1 Tax=Haliotis rufescens TaxID=6454 RepID=UPI00201F6D7B|nr:diacylglycerol lipase-beta-like isoform X1 [Haliotis rufescens]XP_048248657.1 diacylglycerol lipase-beta-like isoform X2 [Haliotis rufescens]